LNFVKLPKIFWITGLSISIFGCSSEQMSRPRIVEGDRYPIYETTAPIEPKPEPKQLEQNLQGRIIVVDAGHGGHDPGCGEVGYSRLPEKTLALAIAKDVETQLKACGARVIMTRTADYFVPLDERAAIADKHKAYLLLSIHIDSRPDEHVSGPTVYIANNASYQSRRVANSIHSSFVNAGIDSIGIRHADFRVLAKHSRPAVLVECGYLTNINDAQKLNDRLYQKKMANLIANGIIN
jgi:N-acetylmuramoyl-L-alanine amidase